MAMIEKIRNHLSSKPYATFVIYPGHKNFEHCPVERPNVNKQLKKMLHHIKGG